MVFPKALPFARLTLGKSISHGYAQSLVATSHSWNATQALQNRFQKSQSIGHNALPVGINKAAKDASTDFGLVEYLKEWQKHQKLGANWRQYQFAKRIEWQPHTLAAETKDDVEIDDVTASELQEPAPRTPSSP